MVILMIAIAMTVLTALSDSTYVAMRLNSAAERRVKAEYILKSAVNVAVVLIDNDKTDTDDPVKDDWMKFTQGLEAPGELLGLSEPNVRVSLLIASEQGKIPLLRLKDSSTTGTPSTQVGMWADVLLALLTNLGVGSGSGANRPPVSPEQLVANLVDYIDTNEDDFTYRNFHGIESSLEEGQKFRNEGKIESLASELSAIPGFTPDVVQQILPFVSTADFQKVNINSAPPQVLMALDATVTPSIATAIIQARDPVQGGAPFTESDMGSRLTALGADAEAVRAKAASSGNKLFEVIAKVEYGTATYMASATINKSPRGGPGSGGPGPRIESLLIY